MAGSGGSWSDEIDLHHQGRRYSFSSSTFQSSRSSQAGDSNYGEDVFSREPQGEEKEDYTIEEDIQETEATEDEEIGPLTPRGKIIGNGFERPIHRQSLQEFENLEQIFKDQSQDSAEGGTMDERFLEDGDVGRVNGGYGLDRRNSGNIDCRSDYEYEHNGSRKHHGTSDQSSPEVAEVFENGRIPNGGGDMLKYMQATPRSTQEFSPDGSHRLSRVMENSYDNDSLDGDDDDDRSEVNGHNVMQVSSQPDFFSLSQEQLPEGPSHLDSEDGSDLFENSRNNTLKGRESLNTVIQAAALNVETFGTGDSPESKKDSSAGDVEHFKPIATSYRRPSRPQTAAQLKNKSISEQSSANEQTSQESINSHRKNSSVKSFRTRSSRGSTPSVLSQNSRRSSHASFQSQHDQSDHSIQESLGQITPRSSTPGHNSTLVQQENEFSLSPVKQHENGPTDPIPRLSLGDMSGRSDQSSIASDIHHLDKSARSRLVSDEYVDQLQQEYDELLQKFAQAENTIDTLRLGARVNLHYEGSPGGLPGKVSMSPAKHGQNIVLSQGQKGTVSSSNSGLAHTPSAGNTTIHIHSASNASMGASTSSKGESHIPPPDASEGKLLALQFQTAAHKEKMDSFEILLREDHLDPADQQRGLEGLKSGQAKLEADYMQAKEEHTMKVRMGSARGQEATFDPERSVEGQLFQLGMRLEDLQEIVQDNVRSNPPEVPVTPQRKASDATIATETGNPKGKNLAGRQSNPQSPNEDYALLLNRYDALKQLPSHPERDREIQQLVKSLQDMPDFAIDPPDIADDAGFHGNDADMVEDEIDFMDDRDDHDGDLEGSSSHSSPFRETTSPDVFRPKGTRQDELPKWQPPEGGSVSSLGSHDHDPPSSVHSRRKSVSVKGNAKQTPPRPNSGHRSSSHPRGDAGSETRKQRGNKSTLRPHQLEPEGDSGFLGSESSRQSLQTRGSDRGTRNRAQRLPPHSEDPKTTPSRNSRIPLYQSQQRDHKTPLKSNNESVPLQQQAVPEEEDSIYSGGGRRERRNEGRPYEAPDSVYSVGSRRTKERRPQTLPSREPVRRDSQPAMSQSRTAPPPIEQGERSYIHPNPKVKTMPQRRNPSHDRSIPLGSQYLSRSASNQNGRTPVSQRVKNPRSQMSGRTTEESPSRHHSPEFDGRSDVTRSSVRSDALRALQDEVNQLRDKMAEARRHPSAIPEETRHPRMRNHGDDDGMSTRSSKSEMLQALQEEIADLKDQLAHKDSVHPSGTQAPVSSTPLRDTIREVLRDRYIPQSNGSFIGASPIRANPAKFTSSVRPETLANVRSPPRPTAYNQRFSRSRDASYTPVSPPPVSRTPGGFQAPEIRYRTQTVSCPMCGGSGTHTHGEYSYPPPPVNPAPPSQEAYVPMYSSPAPSQVHHQTPSYLPSHPSPVVARHSMPTAPQNNITIPLTPGQSYVIHQPHVAVTPQPVTVIPQATQQTPAAAPQVIGSVPTAAPATPVVNQTSAYQPSRTPSNIHPDARPVYLVPRKNRGRYYIRDEEEGSVTGDGDEEFYYRRTGRSSRSRSSSRHTPRTIKHQKVNEVPVDLQLSLDDALHMAQRLKRTTHQMVSSVRRDVRLAESFNG